MPSFSPASVHLLLPASQAHPECGRVCIPGRKKVGQRPGALWIRNPMLPLRPQADILLQVCPRLPLLTIHWSCHIAFMNKAINGFRIFPVSATSGPTCFHALCLKLCYILKRFITVYDKDWAERFTLFSKKMCFYLNTMYFFRSNLKYHFYYMPNDCVSRVRLQILSCVFLIFLIPALCYVSYESFCISHPIAPKFSLLLLHGFFFFKCLDK